jgi:hypothetical protein
MLMLEVVVTSASLCHRAFAAATPDGREGLVLYLAGSQQALGELWEVDTLELGETGTQCGGRSSTVKVLTAFERLAGREASNRLAELFNQLSPLPDELMQTSHGCNSPGVLH